MKSICAVPLTISIFPTCPLLHLVAVQVCQKVGEISLLKQQLRESQGEVTQRASEMLSLRGQLKELTAQLKHQEEAILGLKESYNSKSLELKRCEAELQRTLAEVWKGDAVIDKHTNTQTRLYVFACSDVTICFVFAHFLFILF